ncbi:MAG: nucleotidyl transferase AbiEii/AbiGii toxin family protein [Acidobacteriaceae bacterium]
MDKVALLALKDRAALFGETGAARGVADTIIEKDFWVCWTLKRLFAFEGKDFGGLVFKGGTSLSKAYGAIRRFSEDIDLSFDRADLGYTGDRDPKKEGLSRKKADQLIKGLVADVERYVAQKLRLPYGARSWISSAIPRQVSGRWRLIATTPRQ